MREILRDHASNAYYGQWPMEKPLIRRVVANNPNPFTFKGTGTYIIGHGNVAVVDPGPDQQEHIDAVLRLDAARAAAQACGLAALLQLFEHLLHSETPAHGFSFRALR